MKKIPFDLSQLKKRIPKKLHKPIRLAGLIAVSCIAIYFVLVSTAAYTIYHLDKTNKYTTFVEKIFPYPAAIVNHEYIPLSRFRLEVAARQTYARVHGIDSSNSQTEQFVAIELTNRALYEQALQNNNIIVTDEDVDTKMKDIYTQIGNQDDLVTFLHQNYGDAIGIPEFRVWVKESLVEAAIQQQLLEHVHVSHILISLPSNPTNDQVEAARLKAVDIKSKITDPTKFSDIAKQFSEDVASRDKGGDLGVTVRGDDAPVFSADFQNALFTLPVKTISDPIRSTYGWHIIMISSRAGTIQESMKQYTNELRSSGVRTFIGK